MSIKSVVCFPLFFVVWFIVVLYISAGLSLPKFLVIVVFSIVPALLADNLIGKSLKPVTVITFYVLSIFWFLILPFPFVANKISTWHLLGGYHIYQGKGGDSYSQYQYNHSWSVVLLMAVSVVLGAACSFAILRTTSRHKTKS